MDREITLSEKARRQKITSKLLEFSRNISPSELFPAIIPEASEFAMNDPYAFTIATCLDRQTPAQVIWTIPYDMKKVLGHLDPNKISEMSIETLADLFSKLPRKPRFVNDAPRTISELTNIVIGECDRDAKNLWKNKRATHVKRTFQRIHGVGEGIANMAVLLIERAGFKQFDAIDHQAMDIKPDVQTVKVLYRLDISESMTEEATVNAAFQLNPEYPSEVDAALWIIGRNWCHS